MGGGNLATLSSDFSNAVGYTILKDLPERTHTNSCYIYQQISCQVQEGAMAHKVEQGAHPRLIIARMYGVIDSEDIVPNPETFKLNEGATYVLIDSTNIQIAVPDNFMQTVRNNILNHPNLRHMAIVTKSSSLRILSNMVSKLLHKQGRVSVHDSFAAAEAHLLSLIQQDGLA
jgi:hypothetical protein